MTEQYLQKQIELLSFQDDFYICDARYPAFVAAWGTGKTMTAIMKSHELSNRIPNNLGLIVRKNFTDLKDSTMKDYTEWTGLRVPSSKDVKYPNGSMIMFRHLDELAGIAQNVNLGWFFIEQAEEFDTDFEFTKLRGRLRRGDFQQGFIIANTNGHNWIWRKWKQNPEIDFKLFEAKTFDNAENLPEGFIEDLKKMEERSPGHYRRWVLNSWEDVDTDDRCLPYEHLRRAIGHEIFTMVDIRRIVSCDPAELGDDKTVIMSFEDGKLTDLEVSLKQEPMVTAGKIQIMMKKHGAELVVLDEIGIGSGIRSRLSELEVNVMGVNVGCKSDNVESFKNLKAEIWMNAQEMFREHKVCIPDNDVLIEELASVRYQPNSRGQIQIEKKSETKKRLGHSPDLADAFVLGLYALKKLPPKDVVDYEEEEDIVANSYAVKTCF